MLFVELKRRFVVWSDEQEIDPEIWAVVGGTDGRLTWERLLERKRVVILAEAGSGKSTELEERASIWSKTCASFYATVQDVARRGLVDAIGAKARDAFDAWTASDAPAWFFIDSVDEAKLDNIRLDTALQQIADVLDPYLGRAHIILSGRHTDWEFRRDLARLKHRLPVPAVRPLMELTPDERLEQIVHNETPKEEAQKIEEPLVVVMAGLDEVQVRLFASRLGVNDLDAFVKGFNRAHLWSFARRPLDLQWLAQYWSRNGRFGMFAQMLEQAIAERSRETDPARAGRAPLDVTRTRQALQRIGAALVLSRSKAIAILDSDISGADDAEALKMEGVLPDWRADDIQRLARLPAFDPGTFGRTRLHNDNEGIVRAFLAAEWLRERRANKCPIRAIFDVLFADTYGHALVRPSMRETAAWLALWDDDVARELIERDPFVLLNNGDPGILSRTAKEEALSCFVEMLAPEEEPYVLYDVDALRRFATADLANSIRRAWEAHPQNVAVLAFLLKLIWLGEITACTDLADRAVYTSPRDRHVLIFGGRVLAATASDADKARYVAFVRENAATLPNAAVWDAIDALFPKHLSVADLVTIVASIDVADSDSVGGLEANGPAWAERLSKVEDLAAFIESLAANLERPCGDLDGAERPSDRELLPALSAAAIRLLRLSPDNTAPRQAIDVALRLGEDRHTHRRNGCARDELADLLRKSKERRRAAFWRAAHRPQDARYPSDELDSVWKMARFGWCPGLQSADLDWLLRDAPDRAEAWERALAIDGAMTIWLEGGRQDDLLARIREVARDDAASIAAIEAWTVVRTPSPESVAVQERQEAMQRESQRRRDVITQSWREFADELRTDPEQLRNLRPITEETIDSRLAHLWRFLSSAHRGRNRYAIETTDALKSFLGEEVATAAADAIVHFWRRWKPNVHSRRAPDKRGVAYSFDSMGIAGVAMEAARSTEWPAALTEDDALRAAEYATLEMNGLPPYLERLADRFPEAVRKALIPEIKAELDLSDGTARPTTLGSIAYAGKVISGVMAEGLEAELRAREGITGQALNALLEALVPAIVAEKRAGLLELLLARFGRATSADDRIKYLGAAFQLDPARASEAMLNDAAQMQQPARSEFLQTAMAAYFGPYGHRRRGPLSVPFDVLETLIRSAYGAIHPADDRVRRGSYTPDLRDDAESARAHLVEVLVKTPGRAAYETMRRLNDDPVFSSRAGRFKELAVDRAAADSQHEPWAGDAVVHFKAEFDDTPRTGADLRLLIRRRFEDIQHALTESDFAQAPTLRLLPDERAVQNWMADRLRGAQKRAHSVEREAHVVNEKEPDVRVRARATDASVAIEIKDMNSAWSVTDLEVALSDQLCGRYLRDRNHRHGVLLLVHRQRRSNGWRAPDGSGFWDFQQVVAHLRALAVSIAAAGPDAPDAEVVVIDVAE
ncbi:MAG: hypothetical protein ACREXX_01440 [Gammaproteobacteria bacterium]